MFLTKHLLGSLKLIWTRTEHGDTQDVPPKEQE
jgi:hypothetical protein